MRSTQTSLSVRSARFCPSACLPDGLFSSHPPRPGNAGTQAPSLSPQAVSAGILVAANPELCAGTKYPEKSVGRCLAYLIERGAVVVVDRRVIRGETHATCFYRRVADELNILKDKPIKSSDGVRHVRLMDTRHPYREPKLDRPWRGYTSSLAFLG